MVESHSDRNVVRGLVGQAFSTTNSSATEAQRKPQVLLTFSAPGEGDAIITRALWAQQVQPMELGKNCSEGGLSKVLCHLFPNSLYSSVAFDRHSQPSAIPFS